MKYIFEYDEIICCSECPFYYDLIRCLIKPDDLDSPNYTWLDDGHRPDWCPLIVSEPFELTFPINAHSNLDGTDCPAEKCSACGELFEEGSNFCSWCGKRVIRNV